MDRRPNPYGVLGVARDATPAEIARAFRTLVRHTHPDSRAGRKEEPDSRERLAEIYDAYATLRSPPRTPPPERTTPVRGAPVNTTPVSTTPLRRPSPEGRPRPEARPFPVRVRIRRDAVGPVVAGPTVWLGPPGARRAEGASTRDERLRLATPVAPDPQRP